MTNQSFELPATTTAFTENNADTTPIHLLRSASDIETIPGLTSQQKAWIEACAFQAGRRTHLLLPDSNGKVAMVLFGVGRGDSAEPCGPAEFLLGDLATKLPAGNYAFGQGFENSESAAIAWGLGSYKFTRYKKQTDRVPPKLLLNDATHSNRVKTIADSVWLGRDLINTPANDMGPDEIEAAARAVAAKHGATVNAVVGDQLLAENYPMIHAVGRASNRAPRLIDLTWGNADAPKVTLVGKGICFDTGGLDLKPANAMLLMKKDMGGAAASLALANMIMGLGVNVRLRLLLAVAENSVSGNAFRPGDVLPTRAGFNVEIGNTDAEGRLVLADALSLADDDEPDVVASFATLTGAARVALGADLPAMFSSDDTLADNIVQAGLKTADPVWRLPFWPGYDKNLEHGVGHFNNISEGGFGGAITAALFLKRFVKKSDRYVHFDLFGWRQANKPLGPKGGEPHTARTMLSVIEGLAGNKQ